MAMALGSLGTWKRIADSTARGWCVEWIRREQPSNRSRVILITHRARCRGGCRSRSPEMLRCVARRAATWTAARETAEVEMQSAEDSHAALRGSFEAASASGCEECDPVSQEEERFLGFAMAEPISAAQSKRLYHGRRGGGNGYAGVATTAKLVTPMLSKSEILASFKSALKDAGRNAELVASLAAQAWRNLGDADRAEVLFLKAHAIGAPGQHHPRQLR